MNQDTKKNLESLITRINKNPELKKKFKENPEEILKKNNINPDNLPAEVMEKISGGSVALCVAILGGVAAAATAANEVDQIVARHSDSSNSEDL